MNRQILRLGKNSLIYGLGTVLTRLLALLLLPLFTNYLTPGDYGVIALVTMAGQVLQPLFALGISAGMGPCYFSGANEQRKSATVWTAALLLATSSFALVAVGLGFSAVISNLVFQTGLYKDVVLLALVGIAINNLSIPFTLRLQFEEEAVTFVWVTFASTVSTIAVSVYAVVLTNGGARGMILGQLSGYAVGTLLSILATWRSLRTPVDSRLIRSVLQTSLPLVPSFALLFVITHGNKFFLQFFSGLEAVGIYAIGFSIGMASSVVVGAIQTAWYPYFMSYIERQDEARAIFGRIVTYYVFVVGAISVSFFLCSRPLLVLLTNSAYHDAYKVVGLVATSQFFVGMFSLLLPPLYFAGEVKMVSVVQGGAAIVQCILSIALVPPFGALGAALALCGSTLFLVLLMDRWNRRRGIRYLQIVLERGRIVTFGVFGSVVAALSLIPISFGWHSQAVIVGVGLVSIAICIYVLLRESERSALRHLLWHRTV